MAGQLSEERLGSVLMQAMLAAKILRPQRDRLLQLRRRLKQRSSSSGADDDAEWRRVLGRDLFDVYFIGIEAGARMLSSCLQLAAQNGVNLACHIAFAVIPDEQLYDVLLTLRERLPARPATQTEAFSFVEATFHAVKLAQEHHIPRCIELLVGERPPNHTGETPLVSSMLGYPDDPVAAAIEHLNKNGLANLAKETAAAATTRKGKGKKAPQAAGSIDVDQALTYLHRACSLASLAVCQIELAVDVLSGFVDPKKAASLSELTDKRAYISEVPTRSDVYFRMFSRIDLLIL